MDYPRENDLRQIAHPDGRRVLESWIAGGWRELVGIEIVSTRLRDDGATAHLTLSVKLPCVITMPAPQPPPAPAATAGSGDSDGTCALPSDFRACVPSCAPGRMFCSDICNGLAQDDAKPDVRPMEHVRSAYDEDATALAVTMASTREQLHVDVAQSEELPPAVAEGRPAPPKTASAAMLPGDELIEPRGGRYPAKRGAR